MVSPSRCAQAQGTGMGSLASTTHGGDTASSPLCTQAQGGGDGGGFATPMRTTTGRRESFPIPMRTSLVRRVEFPITVHTSTRQGMVAPPLCTPRCMMLSLRLMLKVSRRCTREKLLQTRRALTPYAATPVVVIGPRTKRQSGAFVFVTELVEHQVALAQQAGVLTVPPGWRRIPVIISVDAWLLWRMFATRADVFVGVWPGGPRAAGVPANWATWWVMACADDRGWLCGMDEAAGLNRQEEYLELNSNVVLENGQTIRIECFLTGDGKGMQVSNCSPMTKCWTCEDGDSLELHDNITPMARWDVFARAVRRTKRVRGYAHCAARLCNAIAKQLASDL